MYNNFNYTNYNNAINLQRELSKEDYKILKQLDKRLLILRNIIKSNQLTPIIITQVAYDGLKDQKLFLINERLKEFSKNNNFLIIKLDEIIEMELNDFYDEVHTTPQGSERIANTIYPFLKEMLIK